TLLVLADRFQHFAERRVDGTEDHEEAEHEARDDNVINHRRLGEIKDPEQIALRDSLDAVLTMGERRLQINEVNELRQCQRDHGEIDALAPDRHDAGDDAKPRRCRYADENAKLRRHAPYLD